MEDLWRIEDSGIAIDELADSAGFKLLRARVRAGEEQDNRRPPFFKRRLQRPR